MNHRVLSASWSVIGQIIRQVAHHRNQGLPQPCVHVHNGVLLTNLPVESNESEQKRRRQATESMLSSFGKRNAPGQVNLPSEQKSGKTWYLVPPKMHLKASHWYFRGLGVPVQLASCMELSWKLPQSYLTWLENWSNQKCSENTYQYVIIPARTA